MSRPRHRVKAAGAYFVTSRTWQSRRLFQKDAFAKIVMGTLQEGRERGFYLLHDFVVMPDHLHLILTPTSQTSLEKAVQIIKGGSSHRIGKEFETRLPVWQKGFHEHWIRSEEDYFARKHYLELNPVRAGLAVAPNEYPYSSATQRFTLDPFSTTSAAEAAPLPEFETAGLKPRPAKAGRDNL